MKIEKVYCDKCGKEIEKKYDQYQISVSIPISYSTAVNNDHFFSTPQERQYCLKCFHEIFDKDE